MLTEFYDSGLNNQDPHAGNFIYGQDIFILNAGSGLNEHRKIILQQG